MTCPHDIVQGYCRQCERVIRPEAAAKRWAHYGNAPRAHRESGECPVCNQCAREISGPVPDQLALDLGVPRQAPAREILATGRSFPCLSCNLAGECSGLVRECRNYAPPGRRADP